MGFLDFAGKRKQINKPQQQPLGYWEEQSYMIAIPKNKDFNVVTVFLIGLLLSMG